MVSHTSRPTLNGNFNAAQRRCKESNMHRTGKSIRARTTGRVLSREGQDRTSTAQTEQAELVRYFTRFTALCYLRDSRATQTPKLVPTQTSQRIANAVSNAYTTARFHMLNGT